MTTVLLFPVNCKKIAHLQSLKDLLILRRILKIVLRYDNRDYISYLKDISIYLARLILYNIKHIKIYC